MKPASISLTKSGNSLQMISTALSSKQKVEKISSLLSSHQGRLFKKVCESMHDALAVSDNNGKVIYVNSSYLTLYGFPKEKILGKNFATIFPKQMRAEARRQYKQLFAFGKVENPVNTSVLRKDGHIIYVEVCYNFVLKRRKRVAMVSLIRDVTNRVLAERKKEEYVSIAHNELKTPLATISAYSQMIQKYKSIKNNKKISSYLVSINKEIGRLNNLINDYLDFDHFSSQRTDYKLQIFCIDELIAECIQIAQSKTLQHKILLKGKTTKEIIADREKIAQVCENLLSNAISYSPKADKILVALESTSIYVRISITDFGKGIAKKHLNKMFNTYFRINNVTPEVQGANTGLYLARKIIRDHAGRLSVVSEVNKGSTFFFDLPIDGVGTRF